MTQHTLADYLSIIRRVLPQLDGQEAVINQAGQNNVVLMVDEQFIFRFPRYQDGLDRLRSEVHLLKVIAPHVTLPIPNPRYLNLSAPIGEAFMGYPMLEGQTINIYSLESQFDDVTCERLAKQLADFLQSLHRVPLSALGTQTIASEGYAYWARMYEQIQQHLFHQMRPDARGDVQALFENYLQTETSFQPTIIHGDFGTGNLLFDTQKQAFSGVIDFGFATVGDPAIDLSAIHGFNRRGKVFFERMMRYYPELDAMRPRIEFYSGTFALQEALHGALNNDEEALQAGLEPYR
ncbi:MAG: phosphotransferase [Chloroflexota bacterium]